MKKVFLFLTMLLFAVTGVMKAGVDMEVEVGMASTTNSYLPDYTYYDYAVSQQIYTAAEIGKTGPIKAISFDVSSGSATRVLDVYMKHVTRSSFSGTSNWESMSTADLVYSGNVTWASGWVTINLTTPFEYNGTDNLLVCVYDHSGTWVSSPGYRVYSAGSGALRIYRDNTPYDVTSLSGGAVLNYKSHIKLLMNIELGAPEITVAPTSVDFGYRPNGAWMAPKKVQLSNGGNPANVSMIESNNTFFTSNAEVPFILNYGEPVEIEITTGTATAGAQNGQMMVAFTEDRGFATFDVTATAYDPIDGDVWEKAINVTAMPYSANAPEQLYKNYDLPVATEGSDAVYKVNFEEDVLFSAGTTGANGAAALYAEGFEGVGGPAADNNYVYNGPEVGPGPKNMWFSYAYSSTNTWYGTSAGGGFYFGYQIPASYIEELELAGTSITTVEAAARESYDYECYVLKGGTNPDEAELVSFGIAENPEALYFFDITLDEPVPVEAGDNIWVIFYSDSPYAAYCGRTPVDANNGKIWTYNPNATSPAWGSNSNYTPVIYTRFIELPTGREVTVDLGNMEIKKGNGTVSELATVDGTAMGTAKAEMKKANRGNRDYQIADMFVPAGTYYVAVASTDANFHVDMMTSAVPVPEQSYVIYPTDGETNVEAPYLAEWVLGDYTVEMQVLVGTQYPPTDVLIDWTSDLVESAFLTNLANNKNYFMQVNGRNAAGTTYGEIVGFSTPIDPVQGFGVAETLLYPGDAAQFTWEANSRSLLGYNLYKDGTLVNVDGPITATEYAVEDLDYNMTGYEFAVTALYGSGESALSETVTVFMTGTTTISGTVYDQDSTTVIPNAAIEFRGTDEYGHEQVIAATADENGAYTCDVLVGRFTPYVVSEGFDNEFPAAATVTVVYDVPQTVDLYTHEMYYPLGMITATEQTDENNVLVEWDWTPATMVVDFETGDFSQAEFTLPASYPWEITTTNPYEGTYAMKSTCEGVASGNSSIEATVEVPFDALMGFWVKVSTETNYDKFNFYIDGVQQGASMSGNLAYTYKEFAVAAGTHTYKWEYAKDGSVNSNDDCVTVDNITMYMAAPPAPTGTTYTFDGSTMEGWTSLDADGDGFGWMLGSQCDGTYLSGGNLGGTGHNASADLVTSGSYSNVYGVLTPDNYLVSPAKIAAQNGAVISFWACAQDAGYAAEHFGVAVSTGSNTASADFTTIQEWTMTAKGPQGNTADNVADIRGNRAQGSWYQYTADLSSYAGQEIWVAIRHFNCSDQFLLNVDDIILGDGSDAAIARGDNRSFQSFKLYRRNNIDEASVANPELIASPAADVFEYIDNDWANLPFGEYQWGIQATYEGNAPAPETRDEVLFTDDFEAGNLNNWTVIDNGSPANQGWKYMDVTTLGWGSGENAHSGVGVAVSWSWNGSAIDQNSYMITPLVEGATSVNYFVNTSSSYPDHYQLMASSTGTNVADFAVVFEETPAKGTGNGMKHSLTKGGNTRFDAWVERNVDLPEGTKYVAFHHVDYDANYLFLDDVTVYGSSSTPTPTAGDGLSEILWSNVIDKDMISTVTVNVALNNAQDPTGATVTFEGNNTYEATVDATGTVVFNNFRKGEYEITVELDGYETLMEPVLVEEDEMTLNYVLEEIIIPVDGLYVSSTGWAMWEGNIPSGPVNPTPSEGQWYYYGDDTQLTSVGAGGAFYWAVMFPAGSYTGNMVTKVANYGALYSSTSSAFSGSVTIYNDGTTAPATAVGTMDISMPDTDQLVEFEFPTPVTIDPSKNLWIVFYNASSADYVASACTDSGDLNGRWVSLDGTSWMDLASAGVSGCNWMIKAYVASGSKDNVVEILDPMKPIANPGTLAMAPQQSRAALSYKVMLDGNYEGETENPYWQHNVEGFEEGSEHVTRVAAVYATGLSDWMEYTWTYVPCDNYNGLTSGPEAEVANDVVTLTWTMPAGPTPPAPPTTTTTYDFDDGTMQGWTNIDNDGDGYGWILGSTCNGIYLSGGNLAGSGHNSSADLMTSGSYSNVVGVLTPDNYLVSPAKAACSAISFWACAQDASYAAEHFGVAVSTTDAAPSAFTMVQEWTMTAKDNGFMSIGRNGETRAQGSWHEYTVDLSAYAGQEIWVAIRHFNCSDQFMLNVDDITLGGSAKAGNRDMWDVVGTMEATSGYQYGVATDGTNIYTCSWSASSTSMFYKYDMEGNFIEEFNISGCGQLRDMTYDGQYFYGGANGAVLYCVDLANKTLVGQTNTSCAQIRHCSYDPDHDGFWVGAWSDLTLIDRTGATVMNGPIVSSVGGSAYYKDADGVAHLYLNTQPSSNSQIFDYNITTNTLSSSAVFNASGVVPGASGSAGGAFVGSYGGKTCLFIDFQQSPQLIAFVELSASTPVPPTPAEGILGAFVFRNGELLTPTPITENTFVDTDLADGEYEYCVRVVYADYSMSCPECIEISYTGVKEQDVVDNIYPNPTSGMVTIEAMDMNHITVVNTLGQVVYDADVNADQIQLNLGQYKAGLYLVRVNTESGVSVKRVTVVK